MKRCRELCTEHGALFVFDEVMTGFRVALGSAQSVYAKLIPGFKPDLTVLGKVIGGGMPLAAFGGPREIMRQLAPTGPVYQAGTLSGNPVATACGLATLREIAKPCFWDSLSSKTQSLIDGLKGAAVKAGVPFSADCQGGMFGFFLLPELPQNYAKVMTSDSTKFNKLFHGLLDRGVYIAPALYEAGFVSAAHTDADIAQSIAAASEVFAQL
jgi:glutamate-1-semialdehyde 2,1-aminomutase